jgi:hypothetical protein
VEQSGGDRGRIEPHVGQDVGHFERVDEVRLAGPAHLSLVLQGAKRVGLVEQLGVGPRVGGAHLFDDVLEPDHG